MDYFTPEGNPCCCKHQHEPYSKDWWTCVDAQHVADEHPNAKFCDCAEQDHTPEYVTADVLYDMTHPTNDREWYGDDYY